MTNITDIFLSCRHSLYGDGIIECIATGKFFLCKGFDEFDTLIRVVHALEFMANSRDWMI